MPVEHKILDYFKTAPIPAANLMLTLATREVKQRSLGISIAPAQAQSAPAKRVRAKKSAQPAQHINGVDDDQPGEAVPLEAIL